MASNSYCDPCSEEGTSKAAIKFCSNCEESLCKDCVEYHKKFKATKSHHLIDLTSILRSKIPIAKSFCGVHQDVPLDFYCTQHDTVCCRVCMPSCHQSCKDVIPLEVASKHIQKSSLLEDTLSEWQNIVKTLDNLKKDRHGYVEEIKREEMVILVEISKWKTHLIKQITASEEKLKTELSNAKKKILDLYGKENSEITELYNVVQEKKQELEFLKEHGSNNQLYLTLREQGKGVDDLIKRVQDMTLSVKKADFKLKKQSDIDIECIGSIEEVRTASAIQYSPVKLQQAQVQPVEVKSLLAFRKEISEKSRIRGIITDVAVTADDKLLVCDYNKECDNIDVFKINQRSLKYITTLSVLGTPYGISVLNGTDKACVTLPFKSYIQCIDTNTLTLEKTIKVGKDCFGITTTGNYIAVGKRGKIKILRLKGETIRNIVLPDLLEDSHYVSSLYYNPNDGSIIYSTVGMVSRIQLNGIESYRYAVEGEAGIAVDKQGHVYVSEIAKSEIQRFSSDGRFHDVVLTNRDEIKNPFAIAFNESCTKFVVTNLSGLFQIYSCK
ncbi:Hypothetical predicted protein [Mytilus galloprovincialis]|uniref:B box-type domain-containing protein n=1 Tax=Mytilus galloprovincialis TaxID=29158 RepID=A0A8B6EI16_MYTGA|nr:Hypothetical predicted protein [Mytilus galloprovincialis]